MRAMMKPMLFASMLLAMGAGCHVVAVGDLDVSWTVDGATSAEACTTHSIAKWYVLADGPERESQYITCGTAWSVNILDIEEGHYTVTIEALDSAGTSLGKKTVTVEVISGASAAQAAGSFVAADFNGSGGGDTLNVYWNINGTTDGLEMGPSWDTCAEVGAVSAVIEVNGTPTSYPCAGDDNGMSKTISVSGAPQVRVKLADASNVDLTTWTEVDTATLASGQSNVYEYRADFYADSFITLRTTLHGDYLFTTTFAGQSCSAASPAVANRIALLSVGDTPVSPTPQVCVGSVCVAADGATTGQCSDGTQTITNPLWGEYKLKLEGALSNLDVCWSTVVDIKIGAGATNPVVAHDVPKLPGLTGACIGQ